MAGHEARMSPPRVTSALSLLHGYCTSVLLHILYYTYGFGAAYHLPVGAVDMDQSATSRNLIRNLDAFGQTAVVAHYGSVADARIAVQEGKIYGFFYIPKGLSADAQSQRQPKISFYTNNSYLIAGSLLFKDMKMMSELGGRSCRPFGTLCQRSYRRPGNGSVATHCD